MTRCLYEFIKTRSVRLPTTPGTGNGKPVSSLDLGSLFSSFPVSFTLLPLFLSSPPPSMGSSICLQRHKENQTNFFESCLGRILFTTIVVLTGVHRDCVSKGLKDGRKPQTRFNSQDYSYRVETEDLTQGTRPVKDRSDNLQEPDNGVPYKRRFKNL